MSRPGETIYDPMERSRNHRITQVGLIARGLAREEAAGGQLQVCRGKNTYTPVRVVTPAPVDRERGGVSTSVLQVNGPYLPDKVFTVTAEGGLFEKSRNELVILNVINVLLLEGSLATPGPQAELGVENRVVTVRLRVVDTDLVLGHSERSTKLMRSRGRLERPSQKGRSQVENAASAPQPTFAGIGSVVAPMRMFNRSVKSHRDIPDIQIRPADPLVKVGKQSSAPLTNRNDNPTTKKKKTRVSRTRPLRCRLITEFNSDGGAGSARYRAKRHRPARAFRLRRF